MIDKRRLDITLAALAGIVGLYFGSVAVGDSVNAVANPWLLAIPLTVLEVIVIVLLSGVGWIAGSIWWDWVTKDGDE